MGFRREMSTCSFDELTPQCHHPWHCSSNLRSLLPSPESSSATHIECRVCCRLSVWEKWREARFLPPPSLPPLYRQNEGKVKSWVAALSSLLPAPLLCWSLHSTPGFTPGPRGRLTASCCCLLSSCPDITPLAWRRRKPRERRRRRRALDHCDGGRRSKNSRSNSISRAVLSQLLHQPSVLYFFFSFCSCCVFSPPAHPTYLSLLPLFSQSGFMTLCRNRYIDLAASSVHPPCPCPSSPPPPLFF